MASLKMVDEFVREPDLHSEFITQVSAALVEEALDIRQNPANPMDAEGSSLQSWAVRVLPNPRAEAVRMLPTLAVMANNAGLISEEGVVSATDAQIRTTVGNLSAIFSGYIAPVV